MEHGPDDLLELVRVPREGGREEGREGCEERRKGAKREGGRPYLPVGNAGDLAGIDLVGQRGVGGGVEGGAEGGGLVLREGGREGGRRVRGGRSEGGRGERGREGRTSKQPTLHISAPSA